VTAPVITLLTDYGPHSEHVGALHALIVAADPRVVRVDLAHDIPPGDTCWGAVVLERLAVQLPGAVHVAVVDPGVGTARRALAVSLGSGGVIIGPDNGVIGPAATALGAVAAVELADPGGAATFAGRDLFVPAALRLIAGERLDGLGAVVDPSGLLMPAIPAASVEPGALTAAVLGGTGSATCSSAPTPMRRICQAWFPGWLPRWSGRVPIVPQRSHARSRMSMRGRSRSISTATGMWRSRSTAAARPLHSACTAGIS
jgi:hypothetical protein